MLSAQTAIDRFRRDLACTTAVKAAFSGIAAAAIVAQVAGMHVDFTLVLFALGGAWMMLSFRSARGNRLAANSPMLIATGRFEAAERQIDSALKSFSVFNSAKLISLHHLAVLRHAQRQWTEAAMLCAALLRQRPSNRDPLSRASRLILADALLEMGDVRGAYENLRSLYPVQNGSPPPATSLGETLQLQLVQLDYEARVNAWSHMMHGIRTKVLMAELMTTEDAARAQAMLALAAKKLGRENWSAWLRRRVELLVDVHKLAADRPLLAELWPPV